MNFYPLCLPVAFVVLLAATGCSLTHPLAAPNTEPPLTVFVPDGVGKQRVQAAILGAVQDRQWVVTSNGPDAIIATLDHHDLVSTLTAAYNDKSITLSFNTVNDKGEPRTTPETWAQGIRGKINRFLMMAPTQG